MAQGWLKVASRLRRPPVARLRISSRKHEACGLKSCPSHPSRAPYCAAPAIVLDL